MTVVVGQDEEDTIQPFLFQQGPFGDWHSERLCNATDFLKDGQMEYQEYQVHIIHQVSRYHPELQGIWVDDAGAGGVSFRCSNGYDLDAGADIHYTSVAIPSRIVFSAMLSPGVVLCGALLSGVLRRR